MSLLIFKPALVELPNWEEQPMPPPHLNDATNETIFFKIQKVTNQFVTLFRSPGTNNSVVSLRKRIKPIEKKLPRWLPEPEIPDTLKAPCYDPIRKLLSYPSFRTEAKKQMKDISTIETGSPLEQIQNIKKRILSLQKKFLQRAGAPEQMDVLVAMMLVGEKYLDQFANKLKTLGQMDLGLVFPEIPSKGIEDEAMYYERLANSFRICVGEEIADSIDLLSEQLIDRFRSRFAKCLHAFLQEDSAKSKEIRTVLKTNPSWLSGRAFELLRYCASLQGLPEVERARKIISETQRHCSELAKAYELFEGKSTLDTIAESLIIALGEISLPTNTNYMPALIALINPITKAIDFNTFLQESPESGTSFLVILSTLQSLTTYSLIDHLHKPKAAIRPPISPGIRLLLETEDFILDSKDLLKNFPECKHHNSVMQVKKLVETFASHKQKYIPFLTMEKISSDEGANLEIDILVATLLADKNNLPQFLKKIHQLDLKTVFYGPHDHPEISFEFTKWVGPIEETSGVIIDV